MRRFLFLDIDGVMASDDEWERFLSDKACDFSRKATVLLDSLVDKFPDIEIIISSTWRMGKDVHQLRDLFKNRGFNHWKNVAGKTARLYFSEKEISMSVPRGCEIEYFIRKNTHLTDQYKYVIFDDDSDMMLWQKDNFIPVKGGLLSPEDIERAIEKLT